MYCMIAKKVHAKSQHTVFAVLLDLQVFVGAFYRTDPRDEHETRSVVRTLIHPDWNPITNYNDIALLYLGAPAMAATLEIAPRT